MRSTMLTVANYPQYNDWDLVIGKNRAKRCKLNCWFVTSAVTNTLGATWERIDLIIDSLARYDRVIWVDADAVLMQDIHEEDLPEQLAFAHDAGGINDGITITVKRDLPMWEIIRDVAPRYKDHPVMVQGIIKDINPIHEILPLDMWNARWWNNYCKIIHFPGMEYEDQYKNVVEACRRSGTL